MPFIRSHTAAAVNFINMDRHGYRLQNSRFLPFLEGAKRRKRDPRVWSVRASHAGRVRRETVTSLPILLRRFYTRSRPFFWIFIALLFVWIFIALLAFAKNTTVLQSNMDTSLRDCLGNTRTYSTMMKEGGKPFQHRCSTKSVVEHNNK